MTDLQADTKNSTPQNSFILYSTLGCHLCDDALDMLSDLHGQMLQQAEDLGFSVTNQTIFTIQIVDIADDSSLLETYGARIPVLKFISDSDELAWPFDIQTAYYFLLPKLSFSPQK